ncbi:hypothetical protein KC222_14665 [Cedecea davisae]|uniref:Uncharacterized protein n=1 Tax=Cedecea davisae TaxID=158484 RepID=A0ABS6DJF3_9ENTR|nr:hypothetical protein [Cedecea davisae]MBU4683253.1 hypothetical protein [Cedecea davisae]MBU4686717.1 hypothetical protein [Cedecea davisae]
MSWGMLLTTNDGNTFITDESTPISLLGRYSSSGSRSVTINITVNTDDIVLPFCVSTGDTFFSYSLIGSSLSVTASSNTSDEAVFTFTCYVFTTREQPLPRWGMAIWDKNGKCILTNETRVLTDIVTIGTKGASPSGLTLSDTRPGKWAILPELSGFYIGVYQQRPFQIGVGFAAKYDGSTTKIHPVMAGTVPPGAQLGTPLDARTTVRAIDVSRYE